MNNRQQFIPITIVWLLSLIVGGFIGYVISISTLKGDPSLGPGNLAYILLALALIVIYASITGLLTTCIGLIVGHYNRIGLTMLYLTLLVCVILILSSFTGIPLLALPFAATFARFLAIRSSAKK